MGPVFKRITMNYPPVLFHPINSITAYKGQIIYDTPETEAKAQTPVPYLQWQTAPGVTPPQLPPDADLTSLMIPPRRHQSTSRTPAVRRAVAPCRRDCPVRRHAGRPAAPLPAEGAGG